jgi:hypothetical protein
MVDQMSYAPWRDFLIEVRKGSVSGHSMVHKFGRNDGVPNGSWELISLQPFDPANFRQSAVAMRVKAGGNAADTAAGAGAREVTIEGIDSTFAELSEAVATAGAGASAATSATFWRVYRAWVSAAGTYTAANTAAIVIEDSGGAQDYLTIGAEEGQTQYAGYTIPTGKTGYLLSVHVTVDSNKTSNVRCFTRENIDDIAAPMDARRLKLFWDGIQSPGFIYRPYGPELSLAAKSDIWFEAYGDGAVSQVSCNFELLLVDD